MSFISLHIIQLLLVSSLISVVSCLKECTNIPTQLVSHSLRAQLSAAEANGLYEESHSHMHLTPTDEATWMDIRPRNLLDNNHGHQVEEFDWLMLYRLVQKDQTLLVRFAKLNGQMPICHATTSQTFCFDSVT
jgi:mRNA-degrading endonuclease YafQ of YafQ-DinJ toxin-antitoxin module